MVIYTTSTEGQELISLLQAVQQAGVNVFQKSINTVVKEDQTEFALAFTSDSFSLIGRNMVAFNNGKGSEYFLCCFVRNKVRVLFC